MTINERISQFYNWYIKEYSVNQKEFSNRIGIAPSQLNSIISGRDKVGLSIIEKFLNFSSNINANWLLKGEAPMLQTGENLDVLENKTDATIDVLRQILKEKDDEIKKMSRDVGRLQLENEQLKNGKTTTVDYRDNEKSKLMLEKAPVHI